MRKGQIPDKVRSQWELWISFYMVTTFKSPSRVTTHNVIVFPMTLGARFLQPNTLLPSLKCIRWRSRCAARGTSFIESIKEASEKLLLLSVAVWLALYILLPVVWHVTRLAKEAPPARGYLSRNKACRGVYGCGWDFSFRSHHHRLSTALYIVRCDDNDWVIRLWRRPNTNVRRFYKSTGGSSCLRVGWCSTH